MKMVMIAALVAAQFSAAAVPAQAAEVARGEAATKGEESGTFGAGLASMEQSALADARSGSSAGEGAELSRADAQTPAPGAGDAPARAAAAQDDEPRKGKSTGDKVLTGAAVVLGVAAVAVAGLLVAIFVN